MMYNNLMLQDWLENSSFGYLRFIDNWHKYPPVSKILCKIGRHDYEPSSVEGKWVMLYCFYCGHRKKSHLTVLTDG